MAPPLFPGHVPTTFLQKGFISVFSAVKALNNPLRADMVAALGETTGGPALRHLQRRMAADAEGRLILAARPLIDGTTLKTHRLDCLPPNTFGAAYARFLRKHGYDPEGRDPVRFVDDPELAYVMTRYRQTHDFAHVLCGLPPSVVGEIALKWFEAVQTKLPMCALSAVVGPLTGSLGARERDDLRNRLVPWALRAGAGTVKPLLFVNFEAEFATPLCDLRQRLGLEPAPTTTTTGRGGEEQRGGEEGWPRATAAPEERV